MSPAKGRIVWFFSLLILSGLMLTAGVSVMIERVDLGQATGPVALTLLIGSILTGTLSFVVLISGRPRD